MNDRASFPTPASDALHIVLNEIGHPVVMMTPDGQVPQSNDATGRLLGSEYVGAPLRYCPFLHEQDGTVTAPDFLEKVIETGRRQERRLQRFGRWWLVHLVPLREPSDGSLRLLLLAQDITAIKNEQEAKLAHQKALTAVLLREIHHRIKNHLQGLVGLLRFHAGSAASMDDLIESVSGHILSIAAVHGLLSAREGSIEIAELVEGIVDSMRGGPHVPLRFSATPAEGPPVVLSQDEAVPLAVSVGELLTNAIKHTRAEPGAAVEVSVACAGGSFDLTIRNHPAGLPEGFRLPEATAPPSGLVLIRTLLPRETTLLELEQHGQEVVTHLHVGPARVEPTVHPG
jgi:two-component sensor histidine kinase